VRHCSGTVAEMGRSRSGVFVRSLAFVLVPVVRLNSRSLFNGGRIKGSMSPSAMPSAMTVSI
jgi:hypothetical protein